MKIVAHVFDKKKKVGEFNFLPQEIIDQIPYARDNKELRAAVDLRHKLEADYKRVQEEYYHCQPSASPMMRYDLGRDVAELLDGKPVDDLGAGEASPANQRELLLRRMLALKSAVESQVVRVQSIEQDAILSGLAQISDLGKELICEHMQVVEQFNNSLKKMAQFFAILAAHGFRYDRRPSHWNLTAMEEVLLYGGLNLPCIDYWLQTRREAWHLDGQHGK